MKPADAPRTCPACGSSNVRLATDAIYAIYLRCEECFNVWSMPKDEYGRIRKKEEKEK